MTVSYFEWVQNHQLVHWDAAAVRGRLDHAMKVATAAVEARADRERVDLRTAAYLVGVGRVLEAYRARGLYP